jgi:uncharacterized protein YxjI
MEDHFDFQTLHVQQPRKMLANRASYEIFDPHHQLLAVATETEAHTRLRLISKSLPDTRVLAITTAAREPLLTLIKQASEWSTELQGPDGELFGRIRVTFTTRHYTLHDDQDKTVARVEGDLALKHFKVTSAEGKQQLARVRKTWAGLTKEALTPSDHYQVEFLGPVPAPARTLIAMMPIVLDLTLYGPV